MTSALIFGTQVLAIYDSNPPSSINRDAANGVPRLSVSGANVGWSDGSGFAIIPATYTDTQPLNTQQISFDAPTLAQWAIVNGVANGPRTWQTLPQPVYTCALWQLQAAMTPAQWTASQAALAALNNPAVSAYFSHGGNTIPSNSPTLIALGSSLGLTADQVAALVQQASAIAIE